MSMDSIVEDTGRKIHEELRKAGVDGQVYSLSAIETLVREAILRDREELLDSLLECFPRKLVSAINKPPEVVKPAPEPRARSRSTMWPEVDEPNPK